MGIPCLRCNGTGEETSLVVDGASCKAIREGLKIEGRALAKLCGIDQSYITRLENGERSFNTKGGRKVAAYLNKLVRRPR